MALDARDVSHGFAQAEVDFISISCANGVIVALGHRDEEGGGKPLPETFEKGGSRPSHHPLT